MSQSDTWPTDANGPKTSAIKHRHDHAVNDFSTASENNNTRTNHPTGENLSEFMSSEPFKVKDHNYSAPDLAVRTQTRKAGDPPASSNTSINFEARGRTGPKGQTSTSSLASGPLYMFVVSSHLYRPLPLS